jgi:hypothetical protein
VPGVSVSGVAGLLREFCLASRLALKGSGLLSTVDHDALLVAPSGLLQLHFDNTKAQKNDFECGFCLRLCRLMMVRSGTETAVASTLL